MSNKPASMQWEAFFNSKQHAWISSVPALNKEKPDFKKPSSM